MINPVDSSKEGFRGETPRRRGCSEMYSLRAGGRLSPPKTLLALVLITLSTLLSAEVQCIWNGTEYVCSGEGTSVVVSGGGGILPPVVTNVVGVCTNCSAISPDSLHSIADTLAQKAEELQEKADQINELSIDISNLCRSNLQEIATYEHFFGPSVVMSIWATNYMARVNNAQTQGMQYAYDSALADTSTKAAHAGGAGNGIYYYANNTVAPQLTQAKDKVNTIEEMTMEINTEIVPSLRSLSVQIHEGATECQGSTNNATGGQGGGALTGDWCTYDQGEAIKSLLSDLKSLLESWEDYLENIQKYIKGVGEAISKGLFSTYHNIPVNTDWKTVYLSGQETNWGYVPTNTLQRIEMLIYGISGVSTNGPVFESGSTSSEELFNSVESDQEELTSTLEGMLTDADSTKVETLGGAIRSFFQAFSASGNELMEGDNIIPSVSIGSGANEMYIPSFDVGSTSLQLHNTTQSVVRAILVAFYMILAAFSIFLYWQWFAEKAISFTRWATELVSSMFS